MRITDPDKRRFVELYLASGETQAQIRQRVAEQLGVHPSERSFRSWVSRFRPKPPASPMLRHLEVLVAELVDRVATLENAFQLFSPPAATASAASLPPAACESPVARYIEPFVAGDSAGGKSDTLNKQERPSKSSFFWDDP